MLLHEVTRPWNHHGNVLSVKPFNKGCLMYCMQVQYKLSVLCSFSQIFQKRPRKRWNFFHLNKGSYTYTYIIKRIQFSPLDILETLITKFVSYPPDFRSNIRRIHTQERLRFLSRLKYWDIFALADRRTGWFWSPNCACLISSIALVLIHSLGMMG